MKRITVLMLYITGLLIFMACEKTESDLVQSKTKIAESYTVPDIPPEIAELMREEDIIKFKAGPSLEQINAAQARSIGGHSHGPARWHPILIHIGYDLQFYPIGGSSCDIGDWEVCVAPGAPLDCMENIVGATGETMGDGIWLGSNVHSVYYPVFCALTNYDGYGNGYFEVDEGTLHYNAEQSIPENDPEGNATFYIFANFLPDESTGIFEGAIGWHTGIVYTTFENNPFNNPNMQGYSDAVHFGWVYF